MVTGFFAKKYRPIGVDIGSRSVKLVQLSADGSQLIEASRWELSPNKLNADGTVESDANPIVEAITRAREGRDFRGKDVILCLNDRQLVLQNLRVAKADATTTARLVQQEGAGRIPFPAAEAEMRFVEAGDVRQADSTVREVIFMACHRPILQGLLDTIEAAGLRPVAVDVEPAAWVRSFRRQFVREEEIKQRSLFLHVGYTRSGVAVHQGTDLLFVKYIDLGGKHLDDAVANHLAMGIPEAGALRRRNSDRRADQQDADVARSIAEACRPILEKMAAEVSMCIRYHSVTFRGHSIGRIVVGGGESSSLIQETLQKRLDLKCELSDPLRGFPNAPQYGGRGQWDVAAGLALRDVN